MKRLSVLVCFVFVLSSAICQVTASDCGTAVNICQDANFAVDPNGFGTLDEQIIRVGIENDPPFVIKNANGKWTGISIELWKRVAEKLKIKYRFIPVSLKNSSFEQAYNQTDVIATLSVRLVNEKRRALTHPYLYTGLGIAVKKEKGGILKYVPKNTILLIGAFFLVALLNGVVIWILERKSNDLFGGKAHLGILAGVIWTMEAIISREHELSNRKTSRFYRFFWIFACLCFISIMTAEISSMLTANKLNKVNNEFDLYHLKVGYQGGIARKYLNDHYVISKEYPTIEEALKGLNRGEIDAVVYPQPNLIFHATHRFRNKIMVASVTFSNFGFGFGINNDALDLKKLNMAMLEVIESFEWNQYLSTTLTRFK